MRKTIKVSNITCANCAKSIEMHFKELEGIEASVMVTSKKVLFKYEDEEKYNEQFLFDELLSIGYHGIKDDKEAVKNKRIDRIDLLIALIFSLPLLYTMFHHLGMSFIPMPDIFMNGYFQWALATPVLFISGRRFFIATYHSIKNKNLGMDSLVVMGTSAAYFYSIYETLTKTNPHLYFETTAVIIFMVLIGNYFENRIKERTNDTLTGLLSLGSKTAIVIRDNKEIEVPVEDVLKGEIIIVKGYDKIPLDGEVVEGTTYVDESMLTGESNPAAKNIGDSVIGSSMNIMETIRIRVTATGSETVLAKIIETVEETSLIKPKSQRTADKIASIFVPLVVLIAVSAFLINNYVVNLQINEALARSIAILVVSCPCALGLATPTSVSVASGMAFSQGVLYKGGEFFETANKISAIAFDKTGTLTTGKPVVTDYLGEDNHLKYTASLEKHSNHPIANAISGYYEGDYLDVSEFETLIGYGIKGIINKKEIFVVSNNYLIENDIESKFKDYEKFQKQGKTIFYTIIDNEVVNMLAVSDEIKASSYEAVNLLKQRGITPYMITGDAKLTSKYIAEELGIEEIYAEVLPHEKADIIKDIKTKEAVVGFVGDGINDAPALKMSDVGFAMGSGSDIAIDTSDVTIMNSDLLSVLYAIDLSLATLRNIYLNFFWAFIYNILMIPLAAFGIFNPSLAGIGMAFSSIMVVLNALSLKFFKLKNKGEKENEKN